MKWKTEEEGLKYLIENWERYNSFENFYEKKVICPLTKLECDESLCASWKEACVEQANYPLDVDKKIWEIKKGYCGNPLITGKLIVDTI